MDEASIFAAALKIDAPRKRAAFLKAACAGDAALRASVESLLAAHDEAGRFLEPAASAQPATVDQPALSETEGTVVGHYKLLQEIGEGGFGVVYMAEQQEPVRRKVAFKIIKPGMDSRDVIARFEAERQALAIMDHPNIAHVLDAGATDSGRPYFVMELVKGVPITEYCDKNKLPTQQRLELFVTVCQAVQHAHQKGVIHRDIKPSNIMVTLHDGKPVPKVIDFGVSKALNQRLTEKTLFTRYGQMVGTPAYMSPEQAEMSGLDVDTRSDIYSLGVLLYELLTGTTPLDANRLRETSYAEMQRIIREDEPQAPSTRLSSLGDSATIVAKHRSTDPRKLRQEFRGELDWIVMKALDKDRGRRYETASALVADVTRYLNGEAVEACPPSTAYRLRKFARRYKPQVTVAAGFLLFLSASSVVAWLLYADARRARNDAVAAQADLRRERDRAIEAEQNAHEESQTAKRERDRADLAADELKLRLYDYNLTKAQAAYDREEIAGTLSLLEDCLPEQRRWEWYRLQRLAGSRRTLKLSDSPFSAFAVSPAEPRIVIFDDAAGMYRLFDLDTGQELASGETSRHSHVLATFSPAGDQMAVTSIEQTDGVPTTTLQVWEAVTGRKVWETRHENEVAYLASFSPDGCSLAFGAVQADSGKATVYLIDLQEQKLIWQHSPTVRGAAVTSFAPDGKRLYVLVSPNPPPSRATLHWPSVSQKASLE